MATITLLMITNKLYHIMLYQAQLAGAGFELTTLVVIGTYYTGSYEFNYHMIMSAPITSIKKRYCYGEARTTSFIVFGFTRSVLNPQSTESEVSMATITLLMMYYNNSEN
jgi:hypothetical protein